MTSFVVSGGSFSALIGPRDALAIHTGAMGVGTLPVSVTLNEIANTTLGEVRMVMYLYHTVDFFIPLYRTSSCREVSLNSEAGRQLHPCVDITSGKINTYAEVADPPLGGWLSYLERNTLFTARYDFRV